MEYTGTSRYGSLYLFYGHSDKQENKPKQRMLTYARETFGDTFVAFQINDPRCGGRRFGAAASWDVVMKQFSDMKPSQRHLFELIRSQRPCKPYVDIDYVDDGFHTEEECRQLIEEVVPKIFEVVYNVSVLKSDCAWTYGTRPGKISLHLVVSPPKSIVFKTNKEGLEDSAYSFARSLKLALYESNASWLAEAIDEAVYSTDREMRVVNSTKFGLEQYPMKPFDDKRRIEDYFITWIDEANATFLAHAPVCRPSRCRSVRDDDICSTPTTLSNHTTGDFVSRPYSNEWLVGVLETIGEEYWQDRESWLRIGAAMKNLGMSYYDFDTLSHRYGGSSYGGTVELWNSLEARGTSSPTLGTLCYFAKESNPTLYAERSAIPEDDPRAIIVNEHIRQYEPLWKCCRLQKMDGSFYQRKVYISGRLKNKPDCSPYCIIDLLTGDTIVRCKHCVSNPARFTGVVGHMPTLPRKELLRLMKDYF